MQRIVLALFITLACTFAKAEESPNYWRVTGIQKNDELNMRRGPSTQFSISAKLPHDTRQLLNLGCYPEFNEDEWKAMSKKERQLAKSLKWCRVLYQSKIGWVFSNYLAKD